MRAPSRCTVLGRLCGRFERRIAAEAFAQCMLYICATPSMCFTPFREGEVRDSNAAAGDSDLIRQRLKLAIELDSQSGGEG